MSTSTFPSLAEYSLLIDHAYKIVNSHTGMGRNIDLVNIDHVNIDHVNIDHVNIDHVNIDHVNTDHVHVHGQYCWL